MTSISSSSLEAIQNLLEKGSHAKALRLLQKHHLPSEDTMVTVVHADALKANGQLQEALVLYRKAALRGGSHALLLWSRIFETQFAAQNIDEAITTLRYILSLDPGHLEAHQHAAHLLFSSTLQFQASCHARHILEKSNDDNTLAMAENVYRFSMQPFEAYQVVKKRQAVAEHPEQYLGLVLCGAQGICEWETVAECARTLDADYYGKGDFVSAREIPLYNIARIADESINFSVAKAATCALEAVEPAFDLGKKRKPRKHKRLRLGLLSADFSSHPVIQLIIGLFEHIDKSRFELFAFDDGKNDPNGEMRMLNAMDKHIDVREQSDMEVAQQVFDNGIDILIDLMGLTTKNRQGVLALRPCPVTATFLGFPGTCGLSKIDYILTDAIVTPDSSKPWYAEKLCRLPEVFMPNDAGRVIAANPVTRADMGLPEDAVVFCSFNRSFKLDRDSVKLWMRILARVPGSVLWQKADEEHMKRVFRETAAQHGVDPERIIFAGNTSSVALHMARAGLADLALDTLIYNGHTITADMLWAGVPVITCKGSHFASRVSSSLLHAVGLDECITHSQQDMENCAVALALNPARRKALRTRLAAGKTRMPLFDTERYTRHFETALTMMLERAHKGLPPDHIDVPALPPRPAEEAFLPDGPPRIFEHLAGTPEEGPYADMAVSHSLQKTPYGIHFGFCPVCDSRVSTTGMPVTVKDHPSWREPLPEKVFWLHCGQCGLLHTNAFWDDTAAQLLRETQPQPDFTPERIAGARALLAPVVEHIWRGLGGKEPGGVLRQWLIADAASPDLALAAGCFGFSTTVLTASPALQNTLTELRYSAWQADFLQADINGRSHAITLEALDTRPYPRLMLARAHALLEPDGFLHIPMLEFDALAWRLMGLNERNVFLQDPSRLHMFTRTHLVRMLEEAGFALDTLYTDASSIVGLHVLARKV